MFYKTLVLNADYSPICVIPLHSINASDAIVRVFNGTSTVIDTYDQIIKTPNPEHRVPWPSVIARKEFMSRQIVLGVRSPNIYYRDMCSCAYCGRPLYLKNNIYADENNTMTIDHVFPRDAGGQHVWENVVACCPDCNMRKANKMPEGEWEPKVRLYAPNYFQLLQCRKHFPITVAHDTWIPWLGQWKAEVLVKR